MARSSNHESKVRNAQLARIHVAKMQLALDDDTYRDLLHWVTGKSSASDMSTTELDTVIREMTRRGARIARHPNRPKHTKAVPLLRKIEALLADAQRPWQYAHEMARHMFGVDRIEFLRHDQLRKMVAALQIDANRRSKRNR